MIQNFDLIVIGSGPAGSASAMTAAQRGLSVALIDKSAFPRDKLCGGGVSGRSLRYLQEIFGLSPTGAMFLRSHNIRLAYNGRVISHTENAPCLQMTMRHEFDALLHNAAVAAGAHVFAPVRITDINLKDRIVTFADGRTVRSDLIIGADGVNSQVARHLFGRAFDPKKIGFGLEVELERSWRSNATTEIDLGAADWGYGWVFPKHGSITLGVGGLHSRNPDMKQHFRTYLARHAPASIDCGQVKCKGAFLPFGNYRKMPGAGRILLVGDAAGLVDPITGEGIAWALKSGQFAAEAVVEALSSTDPDRAMSAYQRRLSYIHAEIDAARRFRALFYARPLKSIVPKTIERHPSMSRTYLRLLAGEKDYSDLGAGVLFRFARRLGTGMLFRRAY